MQGISTAKNNKFRKAIMKLDGRLPDAYGDLITVYRISDQLEESFTYLAGSLERTAFVTLTGQFGDERWDASTSTAMNNLVFNDDFAHHICFMLQHLFKEESNGYKKPSWYYHKATLRRVTRFATQELSKKRPEYELAKKMILYHATVVGGFVKKGDFTGLFDIRAAVRNYTLNIDDFEEIEEYYRAQAKSHPTAVDVGHFKLRADILARVVKQKRTNPFHVRLACPAPSLYEGCWVIVHGLTSPVVGKEIYNNKLGLVIKLEATADQDQERLGFKIDGIEDHKSIKAHKLVILNILDLDVVLVSCLAMSAQWPGFQIHYPRSRALKQEISLNRF